MYLFQIYKIYSANCEPNSRNANLTAVKNVLKTLITIQNKIPNPNREIGIWNFKILEFISNLQGL